MGDRVRFPGERIQIVSLECLARRERHRVHDDVESVPPLPKRLECVLDVRIARDIAFENDVRVHVGGKPGDAFAKPLVLTGERELRALSMHGARDSPGDRTIAGNAEDQGSFALQKSHGRFPCMMNWRLYRPGTTGAERLAARPRIARQEHRRT